MYVHHGRPRRRTRTVAALATGALVASTVAAAAQTRFDDVDHDASPHGDAIAQLADREVMTGKADGRFDPASTLRRDQLATIVARAAGLAESDQRPFTDVGDDNVHAGLVAAAHEAGLVQGYADGTFRPAQDITRDQVAAVLARWFHPDPVDDDRFTDLDGTVHADAINALAAVDVARGFEDGRFGPRQDLRRDQAASFVWRAIRHVEGLGLTTSRGVDVHDTLDVPGVSSVNIVEQDGTEYLVAFGSGTGLKTFDLSDPTAPVEVGHLELDAFRLDEDFGDLVADDDEGTFWSAESMNIDKGRDVAFLSRDPRAFQNPQDTGVAGFYVIDLSDVTDPVMHPAGFHQVPAGHTATCVNDCDYLWSGGPAPAADQPDDWIGRPIFVTDVRDLDAIETLPEPVDTGRYRGATDYAHDVQVDQAGVAWVSGRGGVRGYWTEGEHADPTRDGEVREATAADPVPFAGGEVGEYNDPDDPGRMFGAIHNSERPITHPDGDRALTDSERPRRPSDEDRGVGEAYDPGELIYVTDENFSEPCSEAGKFYIASLDGATDGQGWYGEDDDPSTTDGFALDLVSTWSVADKEGSAKSAAPITCSAHYFQMQDGIVAGAWYTQGFRFLDVTDPTDPIQIAYHRPEGGNAFAPMWHDDVIFAGDSVLGIHVLTLDEDAAAASAARQEILAPAMDDGQREAATALTASMEPDDTFGWSCAIPAREVTVG